MKKVVGLMLSLMLISALTACSGSKGEIQNTLNEFEYACQNLDTDAILNCIDPDVAQPIKAVILIYGMATGNDAEEVLDMLVDGIFGEDFDASEFLGGLSIEKPNIKAKKNAAVVDCVIQFEIEGEVFKENATIDMIRVDEQWFVSGIHMFE